MRLFALHAAQVLQRERPLLAMHRGHQLCLRRRHTLLSDNNSDNSDNVSAGQRRPLKCSRPFSEL